MVELIICGNQNVRNDVMVHFSIGYTFKNRLIQKENVLINSIWEDSVLLNGNDLNLGEISFTSI